MSRGELCTWWRGAYRAKIYGPPLSTRCKWGTELVRGYNVFEEVIIMADGKRPPESAKPTKGIAGDSATIHGLDRPPIRHAPGENHGQAQTDAGKTANK